MHERNTSVHKTLDPIVGYFLIWPRVGFAKKTFLGSHLDKHNKINHPAYRRALRRLMWLPYSPAALWFICLYLIMRNPSDYALVRDLFFVIGVSAAVFLPLYLLLLHRMTVLRSTLRAASEAEKKQSPSSIQP